MREFELQIYRSWEMYDLAQEVAEKYFSECDNDPEKVIEKFQEEFPRLETSKLAFGCGFNYALFKAFQNNGMKENAEILTKELASKDDPIKFIDYELKDMKKSYSELCLEHNELLVPKRIDEILKGEESDKDIYSKNTIIISFEYQDKRLIEALEYKQVFEDTNIKYKNKKAVIMGCNFDVTNSTYIDKKENFEDFCNKEFGEHSKVIVENPYAMNYFHSRFKIKKIGEAFGPIAFQIKDRCKIHEKQV